MSTNRTIEVIRLWDEDHEWAPYLSFEDATKLEAVRDALHQGDLKAASALARIFELTPPAAE